MEKLNKEMRNAIEVLKYYLEIDDEKNTTKTTIVKELFSKDSYTIDLSGLKFEKFDVKLSKIKGREIWNEEQEAKKSIWNFYQKASDEISNYGQESKIIYNFYQKAKEIQNHTQKANEIENLEQEAKRRIINWDQKAGEKIDNQGQESKIIKNHD